MDTGPSPAENPFTLSDALIDDYASLRPIAATFMGVTGHDHRWDDLSPEGVARVAARLTSWRERLRALPAQSDRWSKLAVYVMLDWIEQELNAIAHGDHLVDLNNIASSFQSMRMVFDSVDTSTAAAWQGLITRLETLGDACAGYQRTLEEGRRQGRAVAQRQVRAAIEQGRVHAGEGSFFRRLPEAFAKSGVADEALRARLDAAIPRACAAYGALTDYLEQTYLPSARSEDGVGRERYLRDARRFLGVELNPEETYAWGWTEVNRIRAQMQRLADVIKPGGSIPEVLTLLNNDPSRAAPDRATFLALMRERQERALAALDGTHFDVPAPIRRIEVRETPPGGNIGAYYVPPSEDFSRPGTVWYSLHGDGPFPLFDEVSTAYHEGFPGHHLQCGTQVSLTKNLCRVHRMAYMYSGYAEGWALYTEELMHELGYYEKPEYEFGMLANQMMRACRVVFDIGAHLGFPIPKDSFFHPGEPWTFDLGVEMMHTVGGMSVPHARSEVTRYLGWPGQAISYKVGQRVMLDLRDEYLRAHPGDLKGFHARVLNTGNVGLGLLRGLVLGE